MTSIGSPSVPRGSTLTEAEIVDAALLVIRRDGIDGLSMRRLSRELGVSAMAAYHYVANKDELLDLVTARALADITVPEPASLAWELRLRDLIDQIDSALRHHRGVGEVLLDRMHNTQRHVMRAVMELLEQAGFDDRGVIMAYATIHTYLFGRYRVTMSSPSASSEPEADTGDIVSRIGAQWPSVRGREYYEFGVETIIAGLQAQLSRQNLSQPKGSRP